MPLLPLVDEMAGQSEVQLRVIAIVKIPPPVACVLRHRGLDLRPLVPLVETGDGNRSRAQPQGLAHRVAIVSPTSAVP